MRFLDLFWNRIDGRFLECFSWCWWGSFWWVLLQIGFLLLAEHSLLLLVSSNMMMSEACADIARHQYMRVNSSILQSIAVQCNVLCFSYLKLQEKMQHPKHLAHQTRISRCGPSSRLPNSVRRPGSGGLQAWQWGAASFCFRSGWYPMLL